MFRPLLDRLWEIYDGQEIYVPNAVFILMDGWLQQKRLGNKWRDKTILPYDEDKILEAYQATPIHVPERILEKSVVIEFSLEEPEDLEILKEIKPKPEVKVYRENPVRFGRRPGTKTRDFKNLF